MGMEDWYLYNDSMENDAYEILINIIDRNPIYQHHSKLNTPEDPQFHELAERLRRCGNPLKRNCRNIEFREITKVLIVRMKEILPHEAERINALLCLFDSPEFGLNNEIFTDDYYDEHPRLYWRSGNKIKYRPMGAYAEEISVELGEDDYSEESYP